MNKLIRNRVFIIATSLMLLLLVNIAISYSYYLGKVVGNETTTTLSLTSAGIVIEYENSSGNITGSNIIPGWTSTKSFSVSSTLSNNSGTLSTSKLWYVVKMYIDNNEFTNNSIVYSLNTNSTVGSGKAMENVSNIGIPNGTNQSGLAIGTGYFMQGTNVHNYTLTIKYADSENVQANKKFQIHLGVEVAEPTILTLDLDGGSYSTDTTLVMPKGILVGIPEPTKQDYVFIGWTITSGNGSFTDDKILINSDAITLKATWVSTTTNFAYTGGGQSYQVLKTGYYKIEAWGAQGGGGGLASYVAGTIKLTKGEKLYIYVGGAGKTNTTNNVGGYNGGGYSAVGTGATSYSGGGSTDVRLSNDSSSTWNYALGLKSRIIVAAGGSGKSTSTATPRCEPGGGIKGYDGYTSYGPNEGKEPTGGTQTSGGTSTSTNGAGAFGYASQTQTTNYGGGGGGGYYGGGTGNGSSGGTGSCYISGHTGCVAIVSSTSISARTGTNGASCTTGTTDNLCSVHYSGKYFTDTVMIDGKGYAWTNAKGALQAMPKPGGGTYASGKGHTGNGYVTIVFKNS